MMEGVLNFGTGYEVRQRGFTAPAAGKTGSSHDGWFAGYTSNLLCVVWVGYDDYSDIHLSGAQTAAPIWAEFMKKAVGLPQYADAKAFTQPSGVVDVQLDKTTNLLATPSCPETYTATFIAGTEPNQTCDQPRGVKGFFSRMFGMGTDKVLPPPVQAQSTVPRPPSPLQRVQSNSPSEGTTDPGQDSKKKKGFFGKLAGIFKDDKASNSSAPPPKPPGGPR